MGNVLLPRANGKQPSAIQAAAEAEIVRQLPFRLPVPGDRHDGAVWSGRGLSIALVHRVVDGLAAAGRVLVKPTCGGLWVEPVLVENPAADAQASVG